MTVFATSGILAQDKSLNTKIKRKADSFAKKLKLDNKQRDNAYAAFMKEAQSLKDIEDLKEEDSKKYREERKAIKAKADKQIRKILNKKQKKKYDKMKGKKKKKGKKKR